MSIGPIHETAAQGVTIGILADTHIPDRVVRLHPEILPAFDAAGVTRILHAGDISTSQVLSDLAQVAPVTAVRGNRDFFAGRLPLVEHLDLGGVRAALMHGHGGLVFYLKDKLQFTLSGYRLERYLDLLVTKAGDAQIVIFGHTHHSVITSHKGKLIINPGSATFSPIRFDPPSIILLNVSATREVRSEIVHLRGWTIRDRDWVRI